jgi:hypothetical protein
MWMTIEIFAIPIGAALAPFCGLRKPMPPENNDVVKRQLPTAA